MQTGLTIAACLGPKFDASVMEKVQKNDEVESSFLKSAVEYGFLQSLGSKRFLWAHDQIQQAAYDLIPLRKRDSFHLLVGSRLFMQTAPSDMDRNIFYIVDNMNRGAHLCVESEQKYELAQLNLDAGEQALSSSAFHSATKYLVKGLSLLGPDTWEVKYNLTIKLYDAGADRHLCIEFARFVFVRPHHSTCAPSPQFATASEALFVTGEFTKLSTLAEEPLAKAHSFEDKLNCLNSLVRASAGK